MTKAVFSAGFNWQVIRNKWPGIRSRLSRLSSRPASPSSMIRISTGYCPNTDDCPQWPENHRDRSRMPALSSTLRNRAWQFRFLFGTLASRMIRPDCSRILASTARVLAARRRNISCVLLVMMPGSPRAMSAPRWCVSSVLDKPAATSKTALKQDRCGDHDRCIEQSGQPRAVISRVLALSVG